MPKDSPPKSKRRPPHCTICVGRPLKSQCKCTKAGRAYLAQQVRQPLPQSTPLSNYAAGMSGMSPVHGPHPNCGTATPPIDSGIPIDPVLRSICPTNATASTNIPGIPQDSPLAVPSSISQDSTPAALEAGLSEITQDPPSVVQPSSTSQETPPTAHGDIHRDSSVAQDKKTPRRATKGDPYNGFVVGAQCGNTEYEIVRGHSAPECAGTSEACTTAFLRGIGPLIVKCEDLALRSNCWLFIGAQHVRSTRPVIHYTSPRLRDDGAEAMEDVINAYCDLIHGLRSARRKDAFHLQKELQAKETELQESERKCEEYKQRLLALEALLGQSGPSTL
ncbi:hypothetical protein CC2G_011674 [Coprinopsis cinerea AmutBmut pab1-1]|nr:hypothetical protein CC2G_011674 [Coprinopsis cinerea AmutBmut pab1-1]